MAKQLILQILHLQTFVVTLNEDEVINLDNLKLTLNEKNVTLKKIRDADGNSNKYTVETLVPNAVGTFTYEFAYTNENGNFAVALAAARLQYVNPGKRGDIVKMKKKYIKPLIALENYKLSEMISVCQREVNLTGVRSCSKYISSPEYDAQFETALNIHLFIDEFNCTMPVSEGDGVPGVCYVTSSESDGVVIFNS